MVAVTDAQKALLRVVLALLAIAVGLFGVVRFWPDNGTDGQPSRAVLTSIADPSGTTAPADELQAAIDVYKASVAGDSGDPYGMADGIHRDPEGGRWVEVNRDSSCSWELVDYGGSVFDSGRSDVVIVPRQIEEFRTEPRCSWAYLPES